MERIIRILFLPRIVDPDIVEEWKLNAFYRMVSLGFAPLVIPLMICFAFFGMWAICCMLAVSLALLALSCLSARKRLLRLSVFITLATATGSTFLYMLYIRNLDGLYFIVFMILVAGIFLGVKDAFLWASFNSALLLLIAGFLEGYAVFPDFPEYFNPALGRKGEDLYLSTVIFLYLSSAFLSILFQKYFRDLLAKVKDSQEETFLLETELLQAQKMETIGLLASGIAHEFSHGLTRIRSCANLILKKIADPNALLEKYIDNINTACKDIKAVSDRLLAFARKKKPDMSMVNLHDLIGDIVGILKYMVEKNIAVRTELLAQPPVIRGSYPQLQSAVMNLVNNAVDALDGTGCITLSTRIEPGPVQSESPSRPSGNSGHLVLSVSDTGPGIDEEIKHQIFKPFFTTKPPDKGTGLGLPLVARIVEHHQGKISFQSRKGEGTTFSLHLPIRSRE